jgi:hypothetical protein
MTTLALVVLATLDVGILLRMRALSLRMAAHERTLALQARMAAQVGRTLQDHHVHLYELENR